LSEVSEQRRLRVNLSETFPDVSAALYDTEFRSDAVWRQRLLQVRTRAAEALPACEVDVCGAVEGCVCAADEQDAAGVSATVLFPQIVQRQQKQLQQQQKPGNGRPYAARRYDEKMLRLHRDSVQVNNCSRLARSIITMFHHEFNSLFLSIVYSADALAQGA
jgi:hypothetical protein